MNPSARGPAVLGLIAALTAFAPPCTAPRPVTDLLVVLNKSDDQAALLDPATGRVLEKLPTGRGPHEVAVTRDGRLAFVTNYGTASAPGRTLTVLDLRRSTAGTIAIEPYTKPHGIAISRDGTRVWVTCEGSRAVLELDGGSGRIAHAWPTGQEVSHMLVASRDERKLYVANIASGSCTAIDLVSGETHSIPTGAGAEGIDIAPDGGEVWVANREANTLSVIDTRADTVRAVIASAGLPIRIRFTPDGRRAWVSNSGSNRVSVFDTGTRRLVASLAVGSTPVGIAISPDGRRVFVANTAADRISVIDARTRTVLGTFPTGREPDGMAWARGAGLPPLPRRLR